MSQFHTNPTLFVGGPRTTCQLPDRAIMFLVIAVTVAAFAYSQWQAHEMDKDADCSRTRVTIETY